MSIIPNSRSMEHFLFRRNGKYPAIAVTISLIHVIYLFFFQRIGLFPMLLYNIVCISGYLFFSAEAYKGNKIKGFFFYTIIEIPLHASLSTVYLGWNYRFMLILLTSVTIIFYFVLFIEDFKHPIVFTTFISFIYFFLYVGIRIHCAFAPNIYTNYKSTPQIEIFFTYFNTCISFIGLIFFNVLLAIEYGYIKNKFMSENTKLDNFASFDPLTNLLNRRSTDIKLQQLFDAHYHDEDAFSIIMCDIDKFKAVNDTYGHDAGDYVLKEVAWILKDTVRDVDTVSRWGGEEFLIIVNSNKANAAILAERIRAKVEAHTYTYKNIELHVTITLGVSAYRANTDVNTLIKSADQKLYRGKENGRNQVVA